MKKLLILCLSGVLIANTGYAQGKGHGHDKGRGNGHYKHSHSRSHSHTRTVVYRDRYVKVRPVVPTYTRVVAPRADYVYIQEDWRWDPNANDWVWYGNRWVPAPQPRQVWVPGSWIEISGGGWTWRAGTWR